MTAAIPRWAAWLRTPQGVLALGLFFLNSYNVWADWYGGFTMYGSRGGIGPVIALMVILLAGCITGTVSCFTVRRDKQ